MEVLSSPSERARIGHNHAPHVQHQPATLLYSPREGFILPAAPCFKWRRSGLRASLFLPPGVFSANHVLGTSVIQRPLGSLEAGEGGRMLTTSPLQRKARLLLSHDDTYRPSLSLSSLSLSDICSSPPRVGFEQSLSALVCFCVSSLPTRFSWLAFPSPTPMHLFTAAVVSVIYHTTICTNGARYISPS